MEYIYKISIYDYTNTYISMVIVTTKLQNLKLWQLTNLDITIENWKDN